MLPIDKDASRVDLGVMMTFLGGVESELHLSGCHGKELSAKAWNSYWDILLMNAIFDRDAMINLQGECSAKDLSESSKLSVVNYALRGLSTSPSEPLSHLDLCWLEANIEGARTLLDDSRFRNAVHCLATYRWHSLPRARLALIWAGVEGLFEIESEIVFRLSVHVAQFLGGDVAANRKTMFDQVKRLYRIRSRAVHGGKMAENSDEACIESAALLRLLVRRCIELGALPDPKAFVP
ncbi:hypothetical protein [Burkholderia glumae]